MAVKFEWGDLRVFLAVARCGTTLAAARALGVNQTTCARRVAALERAFDGQLFHRTTRGYALTALGKALVEPAERVEASVVSLGQAFDAARRARPLLRFTTSDWMAEQFAQTALTEFATIRPDIRIVLDIKNAKADLAFEADIALRGGDGIQEPGLIARKVADTPWGFYCGLEYGRRSDVPSNMMEALAHPLAVPAGELVEEALRQFYPAVTISYSSNSTAALADAIASGGFVGPLPRVVGDRRVDLRLCCPVQHPTPGLWIVYHERLRGAPHVRAFVDHLAKHIGAWRRQTAGQTRDPRDQ